MKMLIHSIRSHKMMAKVQMRQWNGIELVQVYCKVIQPQRMAKSSEKSPIRLMYQSQSRHSSNTKEKLNISPNSMISHSQRTIYCKWWKSSCCWIRLIYMCCQLQDMGTKTRIHRVDSDCIWHGMAIYISNGAGQNGRYPAVCGCWCVLCAAHCQFKKITSCIGTTVDTR